MKSAREYRSKHFSRPFGVGQPTHITLRLQMAVGEYSLLRKKSWLYGYIPRLARQLGIRVLHMSINGNHLHLVISTRACSLQAAFLRGLSGVIARKTLRAEKGCAKATRFWSERPYSRLVT
ncbi:MAG: transposase [Deltaproteobacteria bacterium]|nr:transposase [Deltaproteobacteria bacterium]MBI3295669.1 transposase [Deltaproteobacteria bacterium]